MGFKGVFKKVSAFQLVLMLVLVSGIILGLNCEKAFAVVSLDDDALGGGTPVFSTAGAFTTIGEGWDGPGLGSASLGYYFAGYTPDMSEAAQRSEMIRAMDEWSSYVQISWTEVFAPGLDDTIDFDWYPKDHFGSPSVLAHAYLPDDVNPEPIAGDIHFSDDYFWETETAGIPRYDLFAITLHELGHSLGLGHSADDTAVMYPYYTGFTPWSELQPDDIAGIQSIYAPVPEPLSILLFGSGLVGLFGFKKRTGHGEMG